MPKPIKPTLEQPSKPHQHFNELLRQKIDGMRDMRATKKGKQVSARTADARSKELFLMFEVLRNHLHFKIETPDGLKPKHVEALVAHWQREDLAIATIANRLSHLKVFCELALGKVGMVRPLTEYIPGARRARSAQFDKSVSAVIDPFVVINAALEREEWVGIVLWLAFAFGARVNEILQLKPIEADRGDHVSMIEGGKGGRPRPFPIKSPMQRHVLDLAKAVAEQNNRGYIGRPGKTLQYNRNRFYYILRCIGFTKKDISVTAHGLRHDFLQAEFQRITGAAAPIKTKSADLGVHDVPTTPLRQVPPELLTRAQLEIANLAGHNRLASASAYIGSVAQALRQEASAAANAGASAPPPPPVVPPSSCTALPPQDPPPPPRSQPVLATAQPLVRQTPRLIQYHYDPTLLECIEDAVRDSWMTFSDALDELATQAIEWTARCTKWVSSLVKRP